MFHKYFFVFRSKTKKKVKEDNSTLKGLQIGNVQVKLCSGPMWYHELLCESANV